MFEGKDDTDFSDFPHFSGGFTAVLPGENPQNRRRLCPVVIPFSASDCSDGGLCRAGFSSQSSSEAPP